ncbi:MAG: phage portal protein, partial [Planctomycetaceae bacterium]|nr:phage portal protein [Planctomycetaceae bacterium]
MKPRFAPPIRPFLMLNYLRDKLSTVSLKARYERLIHERLLNLTESTSPQSVEDDPGRWQLAGDAGSLPLGDMERMDARSRARHLATHNPHARNMLRLLEAYVAGPGLKLTHRERRRGDDRPNLDQTRLIARADLLWQDFLTVNQTHYSYREHARRAWRDGECFVRKFESSAWPPAVRFVDPERVAADPSDPESGGIVTEPHDVESPLAYLLVDRQTGRLLEDVPAAEMLHTRVGADSNQKRGITIFAPVLDVLDCYEQWMKTELLARKLQSSIVLWRKVQGSPQQATSLADAAASGAGLSGDRRERLK